MSAVWQSVDMDLRVGHAMVCDGKPIDDVAVGLEAVLQRVRVWESDLLEGALPPAVGLSLEHFTNTEKDRTENGTDGLEDVVVVYFEPADFVLEHETQAGHVVVWAEPALFTRLERSEAHVWIVRDCHVAVVVCLLLAEQLCVS